MFLLHVPEYVSRFRHIGTANLVTDTLRKQMVPTRFIHRACKYLTVCLRDAGRWQHLTSCSQSEPLGSPNLADKCSFIENDRWQHLSV